MSGLEPQSSALVVSADEMRIDGHARGALAAGLSSLVGATASLWALGGGIRLPAAVAWLLLLAAVLGLRWRISRRWLTSDAGVRNQPARVLRHLRFCTVVHGLVWGALPLMVTMPWPVQQFEMLVLAIGSAAVAGAGVCTMYDPRAALAFAVAATSPLGLLFLKVDGPLPRAVIVALVMVGVLAITLVAAARAVHRGMDALTTARLAAAERARLSQESEALLRQVFDHIGEGLCLFDAGLRLVAWNERMVQLMGVDPTLVRAGTGLRDLLVDMGRRGEFGAVDPMTEADRRLALMIRPGRQRSQRLRPDGSTVELHRSPLPAGGFTLLAVDISERLASDLALARNRNTLRLLLEGTEEGVWFIDNDQRTTDVNPAMCRLLGVTHEQMLGRSIFDFVDDDGKRVFRDQVERRSQGLTDSYEIAFRHSAGHLVYCQNNPTALMDESGVKVGSVGFFTDISTLKQAATELQRSADLLAAKTRVLESTLESLSQGVLSIAPDGRIEAWNRRALELIELPEQRMLAHPTLREVVAWQLSQGHLGPVGDDRVDPWTAEAQRLVSGDTPLLWGSRHYQRQRKDGTIIEVQLHRAPGGAQVRTFSDVTDATHAQAALRASEARFRTMADAAPAFIWQSDGEGNALWFNQAWLRRLGCPLDEALALSWQDRIHAQDYDDCHAAFIDAVARQQGFEVEFRVLTADGQELWVADHGIVQWAADGAFDGYVVYGWDVTQRKAAERSLIAARDEAQRANRAKSEFLSRMSHELRTPLNAVLGFAQLIEREPAEPLLPLQRERVHQIRRGGAHLLELINEVLDLASIEAGAPTVQVDEVTVDDVLRECLELVQPAAQAASVRLDGAGIEAGLGRVRADATRLRQVLLNLLGNAIKYNHHGGQVRLMARGGPDSVRLQVSDTGPGLTADQQYRLFQAFDRLGAERSSVEGTGIGLALSKALVDLMGGRIGVHSVVGEGSTFWVELPRGPERLPPTVPAVPQPLTLAPLEPPPAGTGVPLRSHQVLYIEDNLVNQIVVESMLARLPDVAVALAADPEQGLAMALAAPPDLVLLDIQLPGINGYEVLARLRAQPATATVPVLAVTANAMPEDLALAREAGFDGYVTKPVLLEELLQAVSALLPHR